MNMTHMKIDNRADPEPLRLFKSDFLEFFTHVHPVVVLIIYVPVALLFLLSAIVNPAAGASPLYIPAGFILGLLIWTLTEYVVHRFVFHYEPKSEVMQKFFFMFHGVHHAQPQCKTRLVMPPAASIPMALVAYGLFNLIIVNILGIGHWLAPVFSGFTVGYITYDMIHYATHHLPMYGRGMKFLKKYHMLHHFKTPNERYGVSSPLWDLVFRTDPAE
jgi:sterol desaturase/sphingolipid hydroxylase (fatty acid hydroxylase superfamily)